MEQIDWSGLFEKFLLDNNIFSQFCSNLLTQHSVLFLEYCESIHPYNYIINGFTWNCTKEGLDF